MTNTYFSKWRYQKEKGFTLIELLVAVLLFALIGGVAINLLVFSLSVHRASLAQQRLVDEVSFMAEYMSRALRQTQKDLTTSDCIPRGTNYEVFNGGEGLRFLDRDNKCTEFLLNSGLNEMKERKSTNHEKGNLGAPVALTSDQVYMQSLYFDTQGEAQTDDLQPRVTFLIGAEARNENAQMRLQTAVSQRRFDIVE